jgi:branched-chain amino acid transport system substrate-binding protein
VAFKQQMIALSPGAIEFVEQAVPLGKIDAGPVVQALLDAKPDAVFSSLFGADLARFVREGQIRGLFVNRPVFNLLGGEPEYLDPLKDEAPVGWWVTGYPWYAIETQEHKRFRDAYQAKFKDYPRLGSVVGYSTVQAAAAAIRKANSTDTEKLITAMNGLTFESPFGKVTFRTLDHQSTMGAYVGRTAVKDGKGVMVDWRYADGKDYLPSDDTVKRLRPAN